MFIKTNHHHSLLSLLPNTGLFLSRTSGTFCMCHIVLCMSLRPILRIQCLSTCIKGKCSSLLGGVHILHYFKLQSVRFFFIGPFWKHVYPLIKIASDIAGFFKSQGRKLDIFNCTLVSRMEIPSSKPQANNEMLTVPLEKLHLIIVVFSFS